MNDNKYYMYMYYTYSPSLEVSYDLYIPSFVFGNKDIVLFINTQTGSFKFSM